MGMGYALTIFLAAVILFPVAWPVWWFLASRFEHENGSYQNVGRPRGQVS